MDGNPEGTPNPLNPTPGTASAGNEPQPSVETAAGTGTVAQSAPVQPASFAQNSEPTTITGLAAEPTNNANVAENISAPAENTEPTGMVAEPVEVKAEAVEVKTSEPTESGATPIEVNATTETVTEAIAEPAAPKFTAPRPMPRGGAVDPMMRRVNKQPADGLTRSETKVDSLEMVDATIDELRATPAPETPDLVAKDSIVEGSKKNGKKKAFIISAIVLLMVAIICGAAAIAVAIVNNNGGDRVNKAIEKLLDGNVSNIIAVQGRVAVSSEKVENDEATTLEGELDETVTTTTETTTTTTTETTVTDEVATEETSNSTSVSLTPFITNTSIDFDGTFDLKSSVNKVSATVTLEDENANETQITVNELGSKDGSVYFKLSGLTDIIKSSSTNTLMSLYAGLFEAIDDEWILATEGVSEAAGNLELFDNTSVCLINALDALSTYGKDLATKYKANEFITYSTDNLKISKKKNNLYKLGINNDKMSAFVNSLGNNGFINELNACTSNTATNSTVTSGTIKNIFSNFPTTYVEVDENNNFTRVYFELQTENETTASHIKADLNLSYPTELKVTEPAEYTPMSELLSTVMTNFYTTNTAETVVEGTANALPDNF